MNDVEDLLLGTLRAVLRRYPRENEDRTGPVGNLWEDIEAAGFPALLTELDGEDETFRVAVSVVAEAAGMSCSLPLPESMIGHFLLARAGLKKPAGPVGLILARRGKDLCLERDGDAWRLVGRAGLVPWARQSTTTVLALDEGERLIVGLVPPGVCTIAHGANLAGEPRDDLFFASNRLEPDGVAIAPGLDGATAWRLAALFRAGQMAGAARRISDMTLDYTKNRRQFGRALSEFQVIQHYAAQLASEAAAAWVSARYAAEIVDLTGFSASSHVAVAASKAFVGATADAVARAAHQIHGAIGFTDVHELAHLSRRIWSWRDEFGGEASWAADLGWQVLARGGSGLWPLVTDLGPLPSDTAQAAGK